MTLTGTDTSDGEDVDEDEGAADADVKLPVLPRIAVFKTFP